MSALKVVAADDHPLVRTGIRALLAETSDLELCAEVGSAAEVMEACRSHQPQLLLLDLSMPGPPTEELLAELVPEFPELKIVILTAHDGTDYVQRVRGFPIHGYLLKDEVGETLVGVLRAVHQGAAWFTQRVALQMMAAEQDPAADLTARERQILVCIARGLDNQAIAAELQLAEQTVRNYASTVYDKLNLRSRVEAVVWARERGLA